MAKKKMLTQAQIHARQRVLKRQAGRLTSTLKKVEIERLRLTKWLVQTKMRGGK